jgi:hypothetical protein
VMDFTAPDPAFKRWPVWLVLSLGLLASLSVAAVYRFGTRPSYEDRRALLIAVQDDDVRELRRLVGKGVSKNDALLFSILYERPVVLGALLGLGADPLRHVEGQSLSCWASPGSGIERVLVNQGAARCVGERHFLQEAIGNRGSPTRHTLHSTPP